MKRTLALFALSALAAPLALAAPNPAWAIPGTEILVVGDRLNQEPLNQQPWDAPQKKWMAAAKDAGGAVPEAYQPLLKAAFGMTPEGEVPDLRAVVCAVTLPQSAEAFTAFTQDIWPKELGFYYFIEHPKVDQAAADALCELAIKDKLNGQGVLKRDGAWSTLVPTDPTEAEGMPLIAWRTIAQGAALAVCDARATADRAVDNTVVPAAGSPLAEAFRAPSAKGPWWRIVVRDVAGLAKRYVSTPEGLQQLRLKAPLLLQVRTLTVTACYRPDGTQQLTVEAATDSPTDAALVRDQLTMFKVLARQMIVPKFYGTPNADLFAAFIDGAVCEAKGNAATLTVTLTPTQAEAFIDLLIANQAALVGDASGDPFEDDTPYIGDRP